MTGGRHGEPTPAGVAAAETAALGTTVRVVVWPAEQLDAAVEAVSGELARLDREASRFRPDSEISRLHARGAGLYFLSEGLAEAVDVALAAARFTGGLVDPTVGAALIELGYDRDFSAVADDPDTSPPAGGAVTGYGTLSLEGRLLHLPARTVIDLGATAKGLGADRAARAAHRATGRGGGVLVSLGGDLSVAGTPLAGGWPILVADEGSDGERETSQVVRLARGAVATSSRRLRRWRRGGRELHHVLDPRTGLPAEGPWQMASVAAATCAEANAASTGALVAGTGAPEFLAGTGLPARLAGEGGEVVVLGGWPEEDGGTVPVPPPRMARSPYALGRAS